MNKIKFMGLAFLCLILTPLPITAGQFDGSVPLLCAVIQVVECGPVAESVIRFSLRWRISRDF